MFKTTVFENGTNSVLSFEQLGPEVFMSDNTNADMFLCLSVVVNKFKSHYLHIETDNIFMLLHLLI